MVVTQGQGWRRLICAATSHLWRIHEINVQRALARARLHGTWVLSPLAGAFAICDRCHARWDDRGSDAARQRALDANNVVLPRDVVVRGGDR